MQLLKGAVSALALMLLASAALAAGPELSDADKAAAFKAAGFKLHGSTWRSACEDPDTASYAPGALEAVGDLNGDRQPEAVITEGSTYCYGDTGTAFWLVTRQANGKWRLVTNETGVATFLATKGVHGWPDIEVGGPGFCFPVERWDGTKYQLNRNEYEGKPCSPN